MKQQLRLVNVVALLVLYCVAMQQSVRATLTAGLSDYTSGQTSGSEVIDELSAQLFSSATPPAAPFELRLQARTASAEAFVHPALMPTNRFELRLFAQIRQYVSFAENLPIHYRKHDLIFPFHYFW